MPSPLEYYIMILIVIKKDMVLGYYNFSSLLPVSRSERFSKQILTLDKYHRRTMNLEKQLFRIFMVALNSKVFHPYGFIISRIVYYTIILSLKKDYF